MIGSVAHCVARLAEAGAAVKLVTICTADADIIHDTAIAIVQVTLHADSREGTDGVPCRATAVVSDEKKPGKAFITGVF